MKKKIVVLTFTLITIALLVTPVMARGCRRRPTKVDFLFHVENTIRLEDNVRWWYDTGESGTGTPIPRPEGAMRAIIKGNVWQLADEVSSYIIIGDEQTPLAPEDYSGTYDIYWSYDVEFPVLQEGTYFVREKITFNTAKYSGYLKIYSIEQAKIIAITDPEAPGPIELEASGVCFGYGKLNGKTVTLSGERHFLGIETMGVENSGVIKFFGWFGR
jgi:hypothetical protein